MHRGNPDDLKPQKVFQRKLQYKLSVGTTPTNLINQNFPCDEIVISLPGTASNSVFWGGQSVATSNGMEISLGQAWIQRIEGARYLRDIRDMLCDMVSMFAQKEGIQGYKQSRRNTQLVLDAHDDYLIATAVTNVDIVIFYTPDTE